MLRAAYTTKLRPFRDSDQEVTIRWYRCNEGSPVLPFASAITSLNWLARPEEITSVGEVFNTPRPFSYGTPIPGTPTGHICGEPDQFVNGEVLNPDLPAQVYDDDGLPVCCKPDGGGIVIGGEAAYDISSGGVLMSGEASPVNPCLTATALAYDDPHDATSVPGQDDWYRMEDDGAVIVGCITIPELAGVGVTVDVYTGDCDALLGHVVTELSPGQWEFTGSFFDLGQYAVVIRRPAGGSPIPYTIEVHNGACPP